MIFEREPAPKIPISISWVFPIVEKLGILYLIHFICLWVWNSPITSPFIISYSKKTYLESWYLYHLPSWEASKASQSGFLPQMLHAS